MLSPSNSSPMIAVTGRISGRDLGSAIADVKVVMAQKNLLPKGSYYQLGGLYEQQQIAFQGLLSVFAAASTLVFLLPLSIYESFRLAIAILLTALLAVSTVFIGLWITHTELNISAMMGMTMIIGMVTEVAIFYFSEHQDLITQEDLLASMIHAGINRMRPIAMTMIAAILTLPPLAFGIGQRSGRKKLLPEL
ncbi:efflux RND transporter permease subunit [Undibacterium sp. 5I1]|uniref:efflux RND transporter permease subunit n=1 Tax=unclassified Undibacterium TaxID=2630295 RepID=UPI002AB495BF|nr:MULTISPECIES: efflux RND transporter permease subunit [unclassified Undibacterium]MDY7537236.1 efflux RND transporter permease subunit [Undibacterium sp. 5I1]